MRRIVSFSFNPSNLLHNRICGLTGKLQLLKRCTWIPRIHVGCECTVWWKNLCLGAYTSGYIPVRWSDCKHSTSRKSQQTAVISVQQPFQVANAKMIEVFIEELPPISLKRQKKYRTILTHIPNWWLKKPFIKTTKLDLKNIVIAINPKRIWKTRSSHTIEEWRLRDSITTTKPRVCERYRKQKNFPECVRFVRIIQIL